MKEGRTTMNTHIGEQIKQYRTQKHLTQKELADSLFVSPQAVSKWELCEAMPDITLLPQLSVELGVTIDELFSIGEAERLKRVEKQLEHSAAIDGQDYLEMERFLQARYQATLDSPEDSLPVITACINLCRRRVSEHRQRLIDWGKAGLRMDWKRKDFHNAVREGYDAECTDWDQWNYAELIAYYQQLVNQHGEEPVLLQWLFDYLLHDLRLEEAAQMQASIEARDASRWQNPIHRALLLEKRGQPQQAEQLLEQAIRTHPDNPILLFSIADFYARGGQYRKAIAAHEQAYAIKGYAGHPPYADHPLSIAKLYTLLGDQPAAVRWLQEAIRLLTEDWGLEMESKQVQEVKQQLHDLQGQ